jgi:hypothetical protein
MDTNNNTTTTAKTTTTAVVDTPLPKERCDWLRRVLLVSGSSWLKSSKMERRIKW